MVLQMVSSAQQRASRKVDQWALQMAHWKGLLWVLQKDHQWVGRREMWAQKRETQMTEQMALLMDQRWAAQMALQRVHQWAH